MIWSLRTNDEQCVVLLLEVVTANKTGKIQSVPEHTKLSKCVSCSISCADGHNRMYHMYTTIRIKGKLSLC